MINWVDLEMFGRDDLRSHVSLKKNNPNDTEHKISCGN
ncbi:hypothetical protein BN938_1649 [Mucinivorans hirudinis]|uniref:Uncharacterized protein n=1 Tax=Mucinivorans hirudinis TaxID=1433126 RepID=A0A060RDE2_9BACT|nr:hypothetical protein BN938_1649 [Mucinivorans hirudinis]